MQLRVKIDIAPALAQTQAIIRQLPFATHKAVDATSKDAQRAIQDSLGAHFTLRRPDFIKRTIKHLQFSTKQNPTAIIGVDPTRDLLAKFEAGGIKTALGGRLAVPLEARAQFGAIVPKSLRPTTLGTKAFKLKTKTGKTLLAQQVGKRRRRIGPALAGRDPNLRIWYVLKPSVPLQPRLHFVDIAMRTAQQRFPINAKAAVDLALRTAR